MLSWNIKTRSYRPIGLDIGHSSIKMIQLVTHDDHISIHAAEEARLNIEPDIDEQERKNIIISNIQRMLSKGNFHGKKVISCLPSGELKITSLRLNDTEDEKSEQAIKRQVVKRFGFDLEKDAMDYIVAGNVRQGDEIKNELVVFAANSEVITNHIDILEQSDLSPLSLDIIPCALFRSFERSLRRQEDKENAVVFVDIGSSYTTIVFGRDGEICFVKQIKLGAENINKQVASKLGISDKEAELLRIELQEENSLSSIKKGNIDASTRQGMVDAISMIAEKIAKEISLCLRYFSVTFRGKRVERAVFTGGGSYENILLDIMRRQLTVAIEIAQPLRGCQIPKDRAQMCSCINTKSSRCEWAIPVGLSLKGWNAVRRNRRNQIRCRV